MKDYYVIVDVDAETFVKRVSAYLRAGWCCQGGVHTIIVDGRKTFWAQAVVR
jgi:hypothetical protein